MGLPDWTSRIAAIAVIVGVFLTALSVDSLGSALALAKGVVVNRFDWLFVGTVNLAIAIMLLFAAHPAAARRLGAADERPEFGRLAWFAMLFSAGLASGLLYWATAEPILHAQANPFLAGALAEAPSLSPAEAAAVGDRTALRITIMHWGLHGWAVYLVVALAISIQAYRHDQPLCFRVALRSALGDRWLSRWPGRAIDLLAVFGTVCGVATSVGLSAASINATLTSLFRLSISTANQVAIVFGVAALGVVSALSGVSRGIRWLSLVNAFVSLGLVLAFLLLGPTAELVALLGQTMVDYGLHGIKDGLFVGTDAAARAWQGDWTVFYWAWWLAWMPFVSLFIARISRGRTIREFVLVVGLVPTLMTVTWMSVFGGTALLQEAAIANSVRSAVNVDYSLGLVRVIENLSAAPISTGLIAVAAFLLLTWLVTSLDSATLVLCHLLGVEEIRSARVFWGFALAAVAAALLVAGGLGALQAASIVSGLPLAMILIVICAGLVRDLLGGKI